MQGRWQSALASIRLRVGALFIAAQHPAVPARSKYVIAVVLAYALSPIDLIPDFIPLLGLLDDAVVVPLGLWLAIRFMPDDVWAECLEQARAQPPELPSRRAGIIIVLVVWLACAVLACYAIWG